MHELLARAMAELPLVAILRGLRPTEAEAIGAALVDAGFRILEVPLNSPDPFTSIRRLADASGADVVVGAGTVIEPDDVTRLHDARGRLVVTPHTDPRVIETAKAAGMACLPGVATPSEAFAALRAGADALKLFPAETLGPATVKAWRAVLPPDVALLPVGGITPENMAPWRAAGAAGFGLGTALYRPGASAAEVGAAAARFVAAWQSPCPVESSGSARGSQHHAQKEGDDTERDRAGAPQENEPAQPPGAVRDRQW
jgi:2-dehydro-3-deoxyphosphogalactonate aldolase